MGFFTTSSNSSSGPTLNADAFQRAIEKERHRSDRSNQKYSLLILSLAIQSEDDQRIARAIAAIRDRIRAIDEIGWYAENQLGIILPFTSMGGADQLADEICEIIFTHLPPPEFRSCELFSYDPERVPQSEMPLWKKHMNAGG